MYFILWYSSDCVDNLFDNAAPYCVQEYVDYDESNKYSC